MNYDLIRDRLRVAAGVTKNVGWPETISLEGLMLEAEGAIAGLHSEVKERRASSELRWNTDMRAIKRWQKAHPGNDLTWPDHADLCVWLLDENARLTARIKRLEEALEPFAKCADRHDALGDGDDIPAIVSPLTSGDLRRARAALEGKPNAQG